MSKVYEDLKNFFRNIRKCIEIFQFPHKEHVFRSVKQNNDMYKVFSNLKIFDHNSNNNNCLILHLEKVHVYLKNLRNNDNLSKF